MRSMCVCVWVFFVCVMMIDWKYLAHYCPKKEIINWNSAWYNYGDCYSPHGIYSMHKHYTWINLVDVCSRVHTTESISLFVRMFLVTIRAFNAEHFVVCCGSGNQKNLFAHGFFFSLHTKETYILKLNPKMPQTYACLFTLVLRSFECRQVGLFDTSNSTLLFFFLSLQRIVANVKIVNFSANLIKLKWLIWLDRVEIAALCVHSTPDQRNQCVQVTWKSLDWIEMQIIHWTS